MGRDVALIKHFPDFMRAGNPGKVLGKICRELGASLDESEGRMGDILRSHRIQQARHEVDLYRLAALFSLDPADFVLIRKFYLKAVFGGRDETGYNVYLDVLRDLISRTVKVFSNGCGTLWALLEGTSILLGAQTLYDENDTPIIEHPDIGITVNGEDWGGFIHRLAVRYRTVEDEDIVIKSGYIYLVENPFIDKSTDEIERRQRERFRIHKGGFFDTAPAVKVAGIKKRTVFPQIINITTRQGIGFLGTVAQGQVLLFTREGKGYLNGMDVTERCYYFEGALFDEDNLAPCDVQNPFVVVEPPGALQRKFPRPAIVPLSNIQMPKLPLGDSDWRFSVREGVFNGDAFNRCVFALPENETLLAALPASGKVQVQWLEHEPFALTILIPDALEGLDDVLADVDLRAWVQAGLERFRGAGIRVNVEYYSDQWILDHSVLRSADALTGSGIFYDGTVI